MYQEPQEHANSMFKAWRFCQNCVSALKHKKELYIFGSGINLYHFTISSTKSVKPQTDALESNTFYIKSPCFNRMWELIFATVHKYM